MNNTCFPKSIVNAGKAAYVERNCEMIDKSRVCVVYYNPDYAPPQRKASRNGISDYKAKSGTKIAFQYAIKKNKKIINAFI